MRQSRPVLRDSRSKSPPGEGSSRRSPPDRPSAGSEERSGRAHLFADGAIDPGRVLEQILSPVGEPVGQIVLAGREGEPGVAQEQRRGAAEIVGIEVHARVSVATTGKLLARRTFFPSSTPARPGGLLPVIDSGRPGALPRKVDG